MRRPALGAIVATAVALGGAGCQDYNFNPVGKCLIPAATERVKLSDVSSADVLFVIDDSGSMGGEQAALANAFSSFVTNLDAYNQSLVQRGLQPFDYHLAVTSTSVMWNEWESTTPTCRSDCEGNAGSLVCCNSNGKPFPYPRRCRDGGACGAGFTCRTDCPGLLGDSYCCNGAGVAETAAAACDTAGALCGEYSTQYQIEAGSSCVPGVGANGWKYPQGDFVSIGGNPRVLHFDKSLYQGGTGKNRQGYDSAQLISFFQANARVGTCGSGQEMALNAAKLAVEKAIAGKQKDTVSIAGADTYEEATRVASSTAEWPHEGAKLVLVFVGDEDDCSSPLDPSKGVVWLPGQGPGADACATDASLPEGSRKQFPVGEFVNYFMGLGRPVGAAFVTSMAQDVCGRSGAPACTPGLCRDSCAPGDSTCGAQAPGFRLYDAAQGLRGQGADVFTGSICDGDFGLVLDEIANIVRPPAGLVLPSTPAESVVALLRIASRDGQTRKICRGPAPDGTPQAQAKADGWDWWFTATRDAGDATAASRYVYINPEGACRANPGETYSADYISRLPAEGCQARADCRAALGGQESDWGCYKPVAGQPGTCICCPPGSTDPACQ